MNFGNFLWGASGHTLGFSGITLHLGAHYNSIYNSTTNAYDPQFDSKDDQLSISRGVEFYKQNLFRECTWSQSTGLNLQKNENDVQNHIFFYSNNVVCISTTFL